MTLGDEDVFGLDIAMHHTIPVCIGQRVDHLTEDPHRLCNRQLSLPREPRAERLAGDKRHDVVQKIARRAGCEERDNVGVLEPGRQPDLALEPFGVDADTHLGRENLDHHLTREPRLLGEEYAAHPTTPELPQDVVTLADGGLNPGLDTDPPAPA
jgi:hypothetical protein